MKKYLIILLTIIVIQCLSQNNINHNLYGFRMSTSFVFFDVSDTSFSNKVIELKPKLLCFPGGFGNFYHLEGERYGLNIDEISAYNKGVKSKLASSIDAIGKNKGHKEHYIYEFIRLAKMTNAKVIFNVNILSESVEDYIKVIEIFKENNLEVIAVELGGELYTKEYKDILNGDTYIRLAKDCAKNIRQKFPEIHIGAVAAPVNTLKRHNDWNSKLAKEIFYDAIIVHSYAKVIKGRAQDGKMIYEDRESLSKKKLFETYRNRTIKYLEEGYPNEIMQYNQAFNNKPIWITEWNFQMSKTTGNTMLQALFVPSYLLELITNHKLKNINLTTFHNLAGRTLSASMLLSKGGKMYVLTSYKPMKVISNIFNDKNYTYKKETIADNCFKYTFKNNKDEIIFLVNWSEDKLVDNISSHSNIAFEYFGKELYSTSFQKDDISYNKRKVRNKITIKPYSFTMITKND